MPRIRRLGLAVAALSAVLLVLLMLSPVSRRKTLGVVCLTEPVVVTPLCTLP
jgi:hypothetical protein